MKALKAKIKDGEVVLGIGIFSESPTFVEIVGNSVFDFVYFDMEHTTIGWDTLERLVATADIYGVPSLIRIEKTDEVAIRRVFEIGAKGVLVPHVCTKKEAERIVESANFPPKGKMTVEEIARSTNFSVEDWTQYMKKRNNESLVSIMIEDKEAVDNLDEILSVEGIDCICFGSFDYSFSAGLDGQVNHPQVLEAFNKVITKSASRRIALLRTVFPATLEATQKMIEKGIRVIILGDDISSFQMLCKNINLEIVERIKAGQ